MFQRWRHDFDVALLHRSGHMNKRWPQSSQDTRRERLSATHML